MNELYNKFFKRVLLIIWLLVIFYFSCQAASDSKEVSSNVLSIFYPIYQLLGKLGIKDFLVTFGNIFRKLAHFTEFFILGILMCENIKNKKLAFLLCFLYAVSDEVHQYFVPGRACRLLDVGIDTCGSLCGILFVLYVLDRWRKKN